MIVDTSAIMAILLEEADADSVMLHIVSMAAVHSMARG
jgi:uncharacterized protein with PIN domain